MFGYRQNYHREKSQIFNFNSQFKIIFSCRQVLLGWGGLGDNGVRMKHTFFNQFSVPQLFLNQQQPFINLVNQILERIETGESTEELEKEIDEMVYRLYDLDEEEIRVIESKFIM